MTFVSVRPPFDIDVNFWEQNKAIALMDPYYQLYQEDESPDKETSSKIMWSLWLYCDISKHNPLAKADREHREVSVQRYYSPFTIKKEPFKTLIKEYDYIILSPAARQFKEEEDSLRSRTENITRLQGIVNKFTKEELKAKNNQETMMRLDKMRIESGKIHDTYAKIRDIYMQEQEEARLYGGGKEGLMESGGLVDLTKIKE